MRLSKVFVALLLILALSTGAFGYTLSGSISGAQWFGGITYVYAIPLDITSLDFYIGMALLGNGSYFIFNIPEGNYLLIAFQDQDGNLIPSLDDYTGFYGEGFPELLEITGNISGVDIEVAPLPFTTVTGLLSCPEGYFGPTYILAATDPEFQEIVHFGIPLTLDGNAEYTLFVDPGQYYVMAYLDADFNFSPSAADPQTYYGAPGAPALVNVSSSPAQNIDLPMAVAGSGAVSIDLTYVFGSPVPASGGDLIFDVFVESQEPSPVNFDGWLEIAYEGGTPTTVANRYFADFQPGWTINRPDMFYPIPAIYAAGSYTFAGKIGEHPDLAWDANSFPFVKEGADNMAGFVPFPVDGAPNPFDEIDKGDTGVTPIEYALLGAYPNPFNPSTAINYQLAANSFVELSVYDIQGRLVAELVKGWRDAGQHEVTFDGSGLASGIYLYKLHVSGSGATPTIDTGKMALMK